MGDRVRRCGWGLVAVAALVAMPALAQPAGQQDARRRQVQAPPLQKGPFGLSPEAVAQAQAQARRIAAQVAALSRQASDRIAGAKPAQAPPAQIPPAQTPAQAAPAGQPSGQPAGKPPLRGPQNAPGGVDWAGVLADRRRDQASGPRLARGLNLDPAAVNRTAIPILLLRGSPSDGARLYSFGDYYTLSAHMEDARLSLTGTTVTVKAPSPLTVQAGPEQLVVQRTVDGQLASFVRYGVLYTVELRCDAPTDPRCRSDATVRDLVARSTVVILGHAARQAAGIGG